MDQKSKPERYADYINNYILPFIDYSALQASYVTDMVYAKGILNRLHNAMLTVYGSERLDERDGDEGFVLIPGVVRSRETGKMGIALLQLDLSSSGEHWGTDFLCKYGVISQDAIHSGSNNGRALASETRKIIAAYVPYDYLYTAKIQDDIHVNMGRLPEDLKRVLEEFRNHHAALRFEHETLAADEAALDGGSPDNRSSVLGHIREAAKAPKEPPKDKPSQDKSGPAR